jgi:hypothetical protein
MTQKNLIKHGKKAKFGTKDSPGCNDDTQGWYKGTERTKEA